MKKRYFISTCMTAVALILLTSSSAYFMISYFANAESQDFAVASATQQPIEAVPISDGDVRGLASLYGTGDNYITNVRIKVEFEDFAPYFVQLEDGYSPSISTFDFGADDKFLFCSSQTGGSGGYGNYRIYSLKTQSYQLVYDDKSNSNYADFSAEFQPNGFMKIIDESTQNTLDVYVGYMDKSYYDKIFATDGNVKDETPSVNNISFVSPALNSSNGIWRLLTYRSIIAIAEVNRLGYIVQTLDFDGENFVPTFSEFAIAI